MSIDQCQDKLVDRHETLTMTVEILTREIDQLRATAVQDGENIRALARIAEIHGRRLTALEGNE